MFLKVGLIFLSVLATAASQDELSEIDKQIGQLEQLQDKYRSSAERNANNAMRWQFQSENYLDARKAWDKAAQDKQAVELIQERIDSLQQRKQIILKENGEKKSP